MACETFRRSDNKRGRPAADTACHCGSPRHEHVKSIAKAPAPQAPEPIETKDSEEPKQEVRPSTKRQPEYQQPLRYTPVMGLEDQDGLPW